uniref:NACHT domain-containing protein n=1 Tax=Latimeria chalumnae TaxID=7897 RepID=H3ALU7_LATCH
TIIISGVPGIGKSTLAQKFLYDWAIGEHHQRFAFIFLFKFRDLNHWREPTSLAELIVKHHPCLNDLSGLRKILRKPENLLFIFDGLDESKTSIDFRVKPLHVYNNPEYFTTISTIVISLMRQILLKGCSVVITSRPTALESVDIKAAERCTEIIGFLAEQRKIYFNRFFPDEKVAMEAFEYVQQNEILYTMCFNPSYCWILCSVLESHFTKEKKHQHCPKTITQLFADFVCNILTNHRREADNPRDLLTRISKMALYGVCNKCLVFYDLDMDAFRIQPSQFLSGFMKEILQREESFNRLVYTFLHLTVQEFLAALSQVLDSAVDVNKLLCKAESYEDGQLEILLRFLSGLCHAGTHSKLTEILGSFSADSICRVIDWLKVQIKRDIQKSNKRTLLNTLHCLYETQNTTLIKSTVGKEQSLSLNNLTLNPVDCYVICYILNCCREIESVDLSGSQFGQEELRKLKPALNKCRVIRLGGCSLTVDCCGELSAVLRTSSLLIELDLNVNTFGDSGIQVLCAGLKDPNCKLQKLQLQECRLTDHCCWDLSTVLKTNSSLVELNLYDNNLRDSGVKRLSAGLMDQKCNLQKLRLRECGLTAGCCEDLCTILSTSTSLTQLDLNDNNLGDSGVKLLCAGVKNPNCKLRTLLLTDCRITAGCCEDLSSVIRTSLSLTELTLKQNNLGDLGVKFLSVGLKGPDCKLQRFVLDGCNLTVGCCGDFSSVLSTNSSLIELDLSANKLGDSGVKLLCAGLKDPNCKLQTLKIERCDLTAGCCGNLSYVLSINSSLTELFLGANKLGDSGVELLSTGLRNPNCKLQKLNLRNCDLTAGCCGNISSVLSTNSSLLELDLGANKLEDSGVKLLSVALKDPNCKLQKLLKASY